MKPDKFERHIRARVFPREAASLSEWDALIDSAIIGGYAPEKPLIPAEAMIACVGSCFAKEMADSLRSGGRQVAHIQISERWNTPFAARSFIELALAGRNLPDGFMPPSLQHNADATAGIHQCEAFIITLGMSVVWYERASGKTVLDVEGGSHSLRAIMAGLGRYTMRQTSVAENVEHINAILSCIRTAKPTAPIIFTLSPIPLLLALTDRSPVVSNTVSKAVLRVALTEVLMAQHSGVFYWPSYEIVEFESRYGGPIWGQGENDLRHLNAGVVDNIMRRFTAMYFQSSK